MKHFAIINDFGLYEEENAVCGNNFHRRKKLTHDWKQVDCPICIKLCGFTSVESDPLIEIEPKIERRRAA